MGPMTPQTAENPVLLTVSGLALSRGGRMLAEGLDFTLARGGVLLVRGPNGAGKSSLLLTLAGILRPEAGTVAWGFGDAAGLHMLGHQAALKPRLTLAETLRFWRTMNGPGPLSIETALETIGLGGAGNDAGNEPLACEPAHCQFQKRVPARRRKGGEPLDDAPVALGEHTAVTRRAVGEPRSGR